MPEYEYDVPAVAIREYFKRFDLPLRIALSDMPEASVMRKVRYRAAQLEERWNALIKGLTIHEILTPDGKIVVDRRNQFKIERHDYMLAAKETLLADLNTINITTIAVDAVVAEVEPLLAPRFALLVAANRVRITTKNETRRDAAAEILSKEYSQRYMPSFTSNGTMAVNDASKLLTVAKDVSTRQLLLYRAVLKQGMVASYAKPIVRHDTSANLERYLSKRKHEAKWDAVSQDVITSLPIAEHGVKSSRTWGIEVESGGARGIGAPEYWDRKGDGSLYSAYSDSEDDYSEFDDDDSRGDCAEFVSPILHSFHSRGLKEVVEKLATQPQNDSAGVHVHVGAKDLTARQIGGLVFAYEMIEPLIETSYRRENREYCKNRRIDETMAILKASKSTKYKTYNEWSNSDEYDHSSDSSYSRNDGGHYIPAGDRYVSLNLHALDAHKTVEFRAMGPVYEYEHLIKWAHFCREMVNLAAKNVPSREWSAVRSFDDVKIIFAKYGVETPAILFGEMLDSRLVEQYADSVAEV
jgi:hypothetical protein